MKELFAIITELNVPARGWNVLATLVAVAGSSYRRPGARLLLTEDGRRIGSISGGCLEEDLVARAREVARSGQPELVTYDTTSENDLIWGVGIGCHGIVHVLVEKLPDVPTWAAVAASNLRNHRPTPIMVVWRDAGAVRLGSYAPPELPHTLPDAAVFHDTIPPPVRLIIFGAGDDARPVVQLAKDLGWHVTVGDPRPDFATNARFPTADAIVVAPAAELVGKTKPAPDNLAVIMTHHYVHDLPLVRDLLAIDLAYVGLLGPKKRAGQIITDLRIQGHSMTAEQLDRFHAPVGLDLGAENPEEIALSIIAEMRAALSNRDARPLRERNRPIHD